MVGESDSSTRDSMGDMRDMSRALLLPDLHDASDGMLKTLALYWDEIILPHYVERLLCGRYLDTGDHTPSSSLSTLVNEGVVVVHETAAELPPVHADPSPANVSTRGLLPDCVPDDTRRRTINALQPILQVLADVHREEHTAPATELRTDQALAPAVLDAVANMARQATSLYLNRLQDAFELARDHNLAPIAHSIASHVGSLVGDYTDDVPRREAALLSAAVDAFEVNDDTPVEDILLFRMRHKGLIGRFRASLVDLSAELQQDASPLSLLASARDTFRNRVQPALADLEAAMNESRVRFLIRSLVGATAITLAPVEPVRAVEAGASLVGQTVNYRFSRARLLREHPFGLLHQIPAEFSVGSRPTRTELELAIQDPEHFLVSVLGHPRFHWQLLGEFWTAQEDAAWFWARILDNPASLESLLTVTGYRVNGCDEWSGPNAPSKPTVRVPSKYPSL
jgi:hypothetical protein